MNATNESSAARVQQAALPLNRTDTVEPHAW